MAIPPLMTGILIMGPYKPLRTWVDEFIPYYMGNNGSWSTRSHILFFTYYSPVFFFSDIIHQQNQYFGNWTQQVRSGWSRSYMAPTAKHIAPFCNAWHSPSNCVKPPCCKALTLPRQFGLPSMGLVDFFPTLGPCLMINIGTYFWAN